MPLACHRPHRCVKNRSGAKHVRGSRHRLAPRIQIHTQHMQKVGLRSALCLPLQYGAVFSLPRRLRRRGRIASFPHARHCASCPAPASCATPHERLLRFDARHVHASIFFRHQSRPPPWAPSARGLWALLIALAILWFATLDARRLVHPDEGRYAEIAREMAATGDWVTPRLNGLKYFEKPPLQYWLTAAAYRRLRRARMDGAAVACARRIPGRIGARRGRLRAGWRHARRVCGARARHDALARGHRPDRHARFRSLVLPGVGLQRTGDRPARGNRCERAPDLDVGRLGRARRRDAVERVDRHRAARRRARRLYGAHPRFRGLAPAPRGLGSRGLPRADGALVRRRRAGERRIRPVLLHPRAFRALSHHGP